MTQEISSLQDGELGAQETERVIRHASEDQKNTWYIYSVIGDTMRGHPPRSLKPPKVLDWLKDQPAIVAPRPRLTPASAARVGLALAASVATVAVVAWIGVQGGPGGVASAPLVAKNTPSIQPVANKATLPAKATPLDVQAYLAAHRQIPSPDLYRPVNNSAPAR